MALKEQLMADFKEAMKARDEIAKNTINLARAAVKQYEVDNREELDDAGIIAILSKSRCCNFCIYCIDIHKYDIRKCN